MKIRIAGTLTPSTQLALARAKSYRGPQPHTEMFSDCLIQYRNDTATILPVVSAYPATLLVEVLFPPPKAASISIDTVDDTIWSAPKTPNIELGPLGEGGFPTIIYLRWGTTTIASLPGYYHDSGALKTYVDAYNPYSGMLGNGTVPGSYSEVPITATAWYKAGLAVFQGPVSNTQAQKVAATVTFAANNYYEPANLEELHQASIDADAAYDAALAARLAAQQAAYDAQTPTVDAALTAYNDAQAAVDAAEEYILELVYASSEWAAYLAAQAAYDLDPSPENEAALTAAEDAVTAYYDALYTSIVAPLEATRDAAYAAYTDALDARTAAATAAYDSYAATVAAALAAKNAAAAAYAAAVAAGAGSVILAAEVVTGTAVNIQKATVVNKASAQAFAAWLTALANAGPQNTYNLTVYAGAATVVNPLAVTRNPDTWEVSTVEKPGSILWNGGHSIRIYSFNSGVWTYLRNVEFTVSADCVLGATSYVANPTSPADPAWNVAWADGYAELVARAVVFNAGRTTAIKSANTIASFLSVDGANKDAWAQAVINNAPAGPGPDYIRDFKRVVLYLFGKTDGVLPLIPPSPTQLVAYGKAVYTYDKAQGKLVFESSSTPVAAPGVYLNSIYDINVYAEYSGSSVVAPPTAPLHAALRKSIIPAFTPSS